MGKTPKKPTSGGDESNLYVRRLKATTTASLNACDKNLSARQRELENPNRGKALGVEKRLPVPPGKIFKSKLRIPATTKSHRAMKNPPRFQPSTCKDEKKTTGPSTTSKDRDNTEVPTMQPESDEPAVQLRVSITKKDVKEGGRISANDETTSKGERELIQDDDANSNGKDVIDLTETEDNITPHADVSKEGNDVADNNAATVEKEKTTEEIATGDNGNESNNTIKNNSKNEESEADNRSSEFEDNVLKLDDEEETPKLSERHAINHEMTKNGQQEKNGGDIIETIPEKESKKSPENCSVDVVESTTSETSDSGNATQSDATHESSDHPTKDNPENDASFISYDSSIMLKDVQIKLNDCLKDNSKLFEVSNVNEESSAANKVDQQKRLDMSFGKTLRNISGRNTINRLRYVTVREHRFSPNSSLFVNTSSASLEPEDSTNRMSRHPNEFSDAFMTNCSPADRKRKIVTETIASAKKLKTETPERTSIFNTSLELFKSMRKPVQVSTPNTKGYNFSTDKYSDKGFSDDKLTVDAELEPKKWCVIM